MMSAASPSFTAAWYSPSAATIFARRSRSASADPQRASSFAQFEREVAGERIRDKFATSRRKGMWMGGNVPLGYDVVGRRLVVNEAEAKTVKSIFERYLELDCVRRLQTELDRLGIRSKHRVAETGRTIGGGLFRPTATSSNCAGSPMAAEANATAHVVQNEASNRVQNDDALSSEAARDRPDFKKNDLAPLLRVELLLAEFRCPNLMCWTSTPRHDEPLSTSNGWTS
jgi:hypothetical protein